MESERAPISTAGTTIIRACAIALLAGLGLVGTAQAEPKPGVTSLAMTGPEANKAAFLVAVSYPLEHSGRPVTGRLVIRGKAGGEPTVRTWRGVPHAGSLRMADRRQQFTYIHSVQIGKRLSRSLLGYPRGYRARIAIRTAPGVGGVEPVVTTLSTNRVRRAPAKRCSVAPRIQGSPQAGTIWRAVPRCGVPARWTVSEQPEHGRVAVQGKRFGFRPDPTRTGADQFELTARIGGRPVAKRVVQVRTSSKPAGQISVRALGDSVTAGFGYYGATGALMPFTQLLDCRPGSTTYNDACSSNSSNTSNQGSDPNYLPDYGLSRNISWAAQWANQYGITNYRNYAVSGSAPADWLPGGQFDGTLRSIFNQNPDQIVMTMGANPLLSDMLFGIGNMECALESDLFGGYTDCVMDAFESVQLAPRLNQLYRSIVDGSGARLLLMQYHLSIPSSGLAYSAAQIEMMGRLLNEVIAEQAAAVSSTRIQVVAPPRFNVGIDMEPLYPADYSCSLLDYKVDGPSVQSTPTQDELLVDHPLSFCEGPAFGPPWVISGDTGIHPSAAGYSQMAGQVPAPE